MYRSTQWLTGSPDPSKIEVKWHWEPETAWRAVFPEFKVGEVWKGPQGHLMEVLEVKPNSVKVEVIHSPKGAFQYEDDNTFFRLDSDGRYNGRAYDNVSLATRVSP
jgi:hypothetical protein